MFRPALTSLGEGGSSFDGLRVLPDGRMVILGAVGTSMDVDQLTVHRYAASGAPDRSFGPGWATLPGSDTDGVSDRHASDAVVAPDGSVAVGYSGLGEQPRLLRLSADGRSTATVPLSEPARPLALTADGYTLAQVGDRAALVGPDGSEQQAFGSVPVTGDAQGAIRGPSALIAWGAGTEITLAQGRLDGHGGMRRSRAVLPQPPHGSLSDARVVRVLAGSGGHTAVLAMATRTTTGSRPQALSVLVAFDHRGRLNTRFGRRGVLVLASSDAALRRDGRLVLRNWPAANRAERPAYVVRGLTATGRPDPALRPRVIAIPAHGIDSLDIAVDRRDRVIVAGGVFVRQFVSRLYLARLHQVPTPHR